MTHNQLRHSLDKLGINQLAFGRLLKADGRSVRHWVAGTRSVPETISIIVKLLLSGKLKPADIEKVH